MNTNSLFYPKDFIETAEGLLFAVVAHGMEDGKVLCFLRYVLEESGWKKYHTHIANQHLQTHYPQYLHFSSRIAADLHAVTISQITKHYQPRRHLAALMLTPPDNQVEQDLYQLGYLLHEQGLDLATVGVTGSILLGVQNPASDIDLVCYDRDSFRQCRAIVRDLIAQGRLSDLTKSDWQASYQRREADLSYEEYIWHEQRKHNKALINGRKFDLSLLNMDAEEEGDCQKLGTVTLQCQIIDDTYGFDYPARFLTDHHTIQTIISFTATYIGQAFAGEWVEVSGTLEQTADGLQRVVVGSNREARGEFIKVIRPE